MLPCALDRFTPIAGQDDVIAFKTQKGLIISRVSASSSAKRMVARGEVREEEGYFISHRTLLTLTPEWRSEEVTSNPGSTRSFYTLSGNNFGCGRMMSRGFYTVCTVLDRGLRRAENLAAHRGPRLEYRL